MTNMITDHHKQQLLQRGYAIVPEFLDATTLAKARDGILQYFPRDEEFRATPERYGFINEDPEHLQIEFPFSSDVLNDISTHPSIVSFVEDLLGTTDLALSQAAIWAKYAGTGDFDQGLHLDYEGHTLVVPRDDGAYRQVNIILYYTDVDATLGPTHVVSQEHTAHLPLWPTHRLRKKNASLYERERPVLAAAGDLLIFSMRTWHRASDITADLGVRFSHHLVYRAAEHQFQGHHRWAKQGEHPQLARFLARATPRQRELLDFPKPGSPYWTPETLRAVALRYPTMDLSQYGQWLSKKEP